MSLHLDTPTEVLHTFLLGVVKYFWGQTVFLIEKTKAMDVFQMRLEALSTDGLNAPSVNAEYMWRYKGSLIGKHFKSLAQLMPFIIYDLVPPSLLHAWNTIGALVVQLWHTEIKDREVYCVSSHSYTLEDILMVHPQAALTRTIEDLLNVTAQCAPSILISKPKFHFLVHLPAYIARFGPAILFSTERYESFNHIFRLSSVYSNRQAPSRDSCTSFAINDVIKHIITGGYWYDVPGKGGVTQAGSEIIAYTKAHPEIAQFLGLWKEPPDRPAGKCPIVYLLPSIDSH